MRESFSAVIRWTKWTSVIGKKVIVIVIVWILHFVVLSILAGIPGIGETISNEFTIEKDYDRNTFYEGLISSHLRDHPNEIENFRGNIKRLTQRFDTLKQFVLNCFRYLRKNYQKFSIFFLALECRRTNITRDRTTWRRRHFVKTPVCVPWATVSLES